jgi:hypothetical protein
MTLQVQTRGRHRRPTPRQIRAMRVWRLVFVFIIVLVVTYASLNIARHSFAFFVFRSGGTGQTPSSFLNDNQGPSQPCWDDWPGHIVSHAKSLACNPANLGSPVTPPG